MMSESSEYSEEEKSLGAKQEKNAEFGRLIDIRQRARVAIEEEGQTDATHLDTYLEAEEALAQWQAHHPSSFSPPNEREKQGERFLRYQKLRRGTYQIEKAGFCMEEAQASKKVVDEETKNHKEGRKGW